MNNKIVLSALAMDLRRVAIGLNRKSYKMAGVFLKESIKRKNEVEQKKVSTYIRKILNSVDELPNQDLINQAENALMYSTLIQNYVTIRLS